MLIRVIKRTNLKILYLLSDFPEGGVELLVNVKEKTILHLYSQTLWEGVISSLIN